MDEVSEEQSDGGRGDVSTLSLLFAPRPVPCLLPSGARRPRTHTAGRLLQSRGLYPLSPHPPSPSRARARAGVSASERRKQANAPLHTFLSLFIWPAATPPPAGSPWRWPCWPAWRPWRTGRCVRGRERVGGRRAASRGPPFAAPKLHFVELHARRVELPRLARPAGRAWRVLASLPTLPFKRAHVQPRLAPELGVQPPLPRPPARPRPS